MVRTRTGAVVAAGLCVAAAAWPAMAVAGEPVDQDRARAAVQAGEAMPLDALLGQVQRTHPGRVLRVELERDDGRWVYELRVLQPGGRLLKLEVDARTGEVLESKERKAPRSPS